MHDAGNNPQWSNEEARFLSALLSELASEDLDAYSALINNDSQLAALDSKNIQFLQIITSVLREHADLTSTSQGTSGVQSPAASKNEGQGPLTSLTEQLSPEDAIELYRKVAPLLVFALLNEFGLASDTRIVTRLVDHLCDEKTQNRLRQCTHVRDGILTEVAGLLEDPTVQTNITREDLQSLLETCGATRHLIAMENCIKLSTSKAG